MTGQARQGTVVCGAWFEDGWISPYVRLVFPAPRGDAKWTLGLYCPPPVGRAMSLTIRSGSTLLDQVTDLKPGEARDWSHIQKRAPGAGETLTLSIRADGGFRPGNGDERELALLVTDWRVDAVAQFFRRTG